MPKDLIDGNGGKLEPRFRVHSDFVGPLSIYDEACQVKIAVYGEFPSFEAAANYCEMICATLNAAFEAQFFEAVKASSVL